MADGDLTTLDAVRAFLQESASDTEQDAIITSLITRASRLINGKREFAPKADGETRPFAYAGKGVLDLGRYGLRAATDVVLDSDIGSGVTLTAGTDYRLRPLPSRDGVYSWLELPCSRAPRGRQVSITGDWGWDPVPADVEQACIVTVAIWLKRDVSAFSATFNLDEGRTERPRALPAAALDMLGDYISVTVG